MSNTVYGATSEEWDKLTALFGDAILPTVCSPAAGTPNSPIHDVVKTPSAIANGMAFRMKGWNKHVATQKDVNRWRQDDRLGICASTRNINALDFDCSAELTDFFSALFERKLGVKLPYRTGKVGRRTAFFRIDVDHGLPKAQLKVRNTDSDMIELLATRQQTVLAGMHKSGVRYAWPAGIPDAVPTLTLAQFTEVWDEINAEYGQAPQPYNPTGLTDRVLGSPLSSIDPFVDFLYEHSTVKGQDGSAIHIQCPWSDEHSTASTLTASTYFSPDTEHPTGAYVCLHGHCQHRNLAALHNKLGYSQDAVVVQDFADVVLKQRPIWPDPVYEILGGKEKNIILNHVLNHEVALSHPPTSGFEILYDEFTHATMVRDIKQEEWRRLAQTDFQQIKLNIARVTRMDMPVKLVENEVARISRTKSRDSAQQMIANLPKWDGVPRVAKFCSGILKTEDSDYHTAVSKYIWAALVSRAKYKESLAEGMPVLIGKQGTGKSWIVSALVPPELEAVTGMKPDTSLNLSDKSTDITIKMTGRLVAELAELSGFSKKDDGALKAFITEREENIVHKYHSQGTQVKKRYVVFGTTNNRRFLKDETGSRRMFPLITGRKIDVDSFIANREQYWAEALHNINVDTSKDTYLKANNLAGLARNKATMLHPLHHQIREYAVDNVGFRLHSLWASIQGLARMNMDGYPLYMVRLSLMALGFVEDDDTGIWDYENKEDLW